jgi:hypothetical protein
MVFAGVLVIHFVVVAAGGVGDPPVSSWDRSVKGRPN